VEYNPYSSDPLFLFFFFWNLFSHSVCFVDMLPHLIWLGLGRLTMPGKKRETVSATCPCTGKLGLINRSCGRYTICIRAALCRRGKQNLCMDSEVLLPGYLGEVWRVQVWWWWWWLSGAVMLRANQSLPALPRRNTCRRQCGRVPGIPWGEEEKVGWRCLVFVPRRFLVNRVCALYLFPSRCGYRVR